MIIVTGGAGFIGSNLIAKLNKLGISDILLVDHLKNGRKMYNIARLDIKDFIDREDFLNMIESNVDFGKIEAVFHLGACSSTTEWDGQFIMRNNFSYSKSLLNWCQKIGASFIYASSASVYGLGNSGFAEVRNNENPINMYAYSKWQFDQYVRSHSVHFSAQVVGLRYFNVYGPNEAHKGTMASTPFHFNNQILNEQICRVFSGSSGYSDGEQMRDFVYVEDVASVNLWFFKNPDKFGIFNLGTGRARSFNDIANTVLKWHKKYRGIDARLEYIEFPEKLLGSYQSFTRADLSLLRSSGYQHEFISIEQGIEMYLNIINKDLII